MFSMLSSIMWVSMTINGHPASVQQSHSAPTTHVYKKAGELEIKLDVYRFKDDTTRPAVVWIHGGALINGHRAGISNKVRRWSAAKGYVLISIDYRLAPETRLPLIIEDVEDAFRWIRRTGPSLASIDPDRIAVAGGSAGGYLTLTSGFRVKPRPKVLLSLWGYGDLVGKWYSSPSPHPRHHRTKLTSDEAWKQVSGDPISDSRLRKGNGGAFYQYCRQKGVWPKSVSGWDPIKEQEKYHPFMPVRNVDDQYPPTAMIHGDRDTDVPFEQSMMMVEQFKKHGIDHKMFRIVGGEHGLGGGKPDQIERAYRQAFEFVDSRLEPAK